MKPHSLSHKIHAVRYVRNLMSAGQSLRAACREANVPLGSFQIWQARIDEAGEAGLAARYRNCGRKPKWSLTDEEKNALRGLVLLRDSQTFAIEEFINGHPACRAETREAIVQEITTARHERRYPRWSSSMRAAVTVTVEDRRKLRGSRAFEAISFNPRKGLFYVDEEGRNIQLSPNMCWVMDDYSTNQPYIVETEHGAPKLCRQVLAAMDVYSAGWLSVEMIGRERNQYRGEDILRFILRTIEGQGTMPVFLLLERGRWEGQAVHGLNLEPALGPKFKDRTWGGLDELFTIIHGFSSRHKAVEESSFSLLQRALAFSGAEIGRFRGEFEASMKNYLAIQSQAKDIADGKQIKRMIDPAARGFLSIDESREAHWNRMQYLNERGRMRAATGTVEVPNDLLGLFDPASDARPLPEADRWRFLPTKRVATVGSIRSGFVQLTVDPYRKPFIFQINGVPGGPNLPIGHKVLVAFDPATPSKGAHICNGEPGPLNRERMSIGDFIMHAPAWDDAPMFSLAPKGGYRDGSKRRANAAASTAFAAINPLGRRGLAVSQRHDGEGNASIASTGARSATAGISGHTARRDPLDMPEATDRSAISHPQSAIRNPPSAIALRALEDAALEHLSVL